MINRSGSSQSVPQSENSLLESKKRSSVLVHTKPKQRANKSPKQYRSIFRFRKEKGFRHSDITDGPSQLQAVGGSVPWPAKVINAPSSAHQSSLSSLPANMEVCRPQHVLSQQFSVTTPTASTTLVTATGRPNVCPIPYAVAQASTTADGKMAHALTNQSPSTIPISVETVKSTYESAVTSHTPVTNSLTAIKPALECQACRSAVGNYRAPCNHTKIHKGGDERKFSTVEKLFHSVKAAKAQAKQSTTQKRTHSVAASTAATISSASDSALQPPPSKHGKGEPPQLFKFENTSKVSQDSFKKTSGGIPLSGLWRFPSSIGEKGAHQSLDSPPLVTSLRSYFTGKPFTPERNCPQESSAVHTASVPKIKWRFPSSIGEKVDHQSLDSPPLVTSLKSYFIGKPFTSERNCPQESSAVHPASMPKNNASDFEGSSTGSLDSEDVSLEFETVASAENQGELEDCDENMKQAVDCYSDKYLQLVSKSFDNLSRDDEDTSAMSKEFMQKYLKVKRDLGSEELKLLKILFFGPPGVGKSTLLSVLLCQDVQSLRESTGVLDQKLVQFKVAVQRDDAKAISQWKIINTDEEILRLRRTIEEKLKKCASEQGNDCHTDLKPDMKIDEKLQTSVDKMMSEGQNQSPSSQQHFTISNTLIACYDSGGQPEFFDVMPAFISSTTGNVMVFDMSKDLHSNLDPEFFKNGRHWTSSNIKTHYTGAQLLKTALANIQSYAIDYPLCSAKSSHCGSSRLLVVGTHLDLCGDTEDKVCKRLCQMEKTICGDVLHDCSAVSVINRCRGKYTKTIFPIANKCDDNDCDEVIRDREEVAQEIRTAIETMSENEKASKEIPISWLLFQYEIKLHSVPFISRSDCDKIAEKCYINKNDVDDVLRYFHELGIFLYYQDKDKRLSRVIFSDPQWLFAQLTKLIEVKYNPSYDTEGSIKKGIFRKQFLTEIYGKEFNTDLLHYEDIINLFVHLNIMARLSDATEQYFMPALLNPFSNDISINATFGNKVLSTLYVKFKDGFFPRGVFCCLIALCVKKNKSWKLQSNAAYKDLVVFQIENNEEFLILSDNIHYISLEIHCKEELQQNRHQVLSCVLYENLKEVCNAIHLDGEFKFGFRCKGKRCEKFAHVQVQYPYYPENLLCSVCEYNPRMTYDQLIWFIPPKVLDVLTKSTSSMLSSCASTPTDQPCDHKMLLAQKAQMHELAEIISPRIMDKWERLAYSMRYKPGEVEALKKDSHDAKECCIKLFTNWLTTSHGPTPKTYQTLLNHIKQVKDLAAVSKAIENELMQQQ